MGHYGSKLLETFDIFHYEEEEVKILPSHQLPSNSLGKILDNIEVLTMESDGDLTLSASINLQKWEPSQRAFQLVLYKSLLKNLKNQQIPKDKRLEFEYISLRDFHAISTFFFIGSKRCPCDVEWYTCFNEAHPNASLVYESLNQITFKNIKLLPPPLYKNRTEALKTIQDANDVFILGGYDSQDTYDFGILSAYKKLPMCSGSSTAIFDKPDLHSNPYLFRTIPTDDYTAHSFVQFLKNLNIQTIVVVLEDSKYADNVQHYLSQSTIKITAFHRILPSVSLTQIAEEIERQEARVVLYVGVEETFEKFSFYALNKGIIGRDWVWFGLDGLAALASHPELVKDTLATNGLFVFLPSSIQGSGPAYLALYKKCLEFFEELEGNKENFQDFKEKVKQTIDNKGFQILNFYNKTFKIVGSYSLTETKFENATYFDGSLKRPEGVTKIVFMAPERSDVVVVSIFGTTATLIILIILSCVYLCCNSGHKTVKSMSLPFVVLISIGICIFLGSVFFIPGEKSKFTCNLEYWSSMVGFQLVISAVCAKAYRIWLIFENFSVTNIERVSNVNLMKFCFLSTFAMLALLAVLANYAPFEVRVITLFGEHHRCEVETPLFGSLIRGITICYCTFLIGITAFLGFKTRKAYSSFKESSYILYSSQNMIVVLLLCLTINLMDFHKLPYFFFILQMILHIYVSLVTYMLLVGRVVLRLFLDKKSKRQNNTLRTNRFSAVESYADMGVGECHPPDETLIGTPVMTCFDHALKKSYMFGFYPVKKMSSFLGKWRIQQVMLFSIEGFFAIIPPSRNPSIVPNREAVQESKIKSLFEAKPGHVFHLRSIKFSSSVSHKNSIEVRMGGDHAYIIQFNDLEDKNLWLKAFKIYCCSSQLDFDSFESIQNQ